MPANNTKSNTRPNYPKKQPKPAPSQEEAVASRLQRLSSQCAAGASYNACKTVDQLLRLLPEDQKLLQTKAQLLLSLDQYQDAAKIPIKSIETAYAQYKLGHFSEAAQQLEQIKETTEDSRELRLLEAQIRFKTEDYQVAAQLYQELLVTAEPDSPEYTDIQFNLEASESYMAFKEDMLASVAQQSTSMTTVLDDAPVGLLVAQQYPSQPKQAAAVAAPESEPEKKKNKKPSMAKSSARKQQRPAKLPPSIAAMPEDQRPAPDPERWLPKQQRAGYVDPRKSKEEERRRKQKEKASTQGSASSGAAQGNNAGQSGGGGGKKGKSKKRS